MKSCNYFSSSRLLRLNTCSTLLLSVLIVVTITSVQISGVDSSSVIQPLNLELLDNSNVDVTTNAYSETETESESLDLGVESETEQSTTTSSRLRSSVEEADVLGEDETDTDSDSDSGVFANIINPRSECDFPGIDDPSEYSLGTVELLEREGYPAESHCVTSEDGYISEIHRLPAPGKPVVYILHGIFQSSRDLLMNCEGRAIAHKLYNDGYDVWLGNMRGNSYSKNHTSLPTNSFAYWKWGIDEVAMYDCTAIVDYILKNTGQEKLNYIGYSLGSNILYAMLSAVPEYNDKINVGITLANTVLMAHARSPPFKVLAPIRRLVELFFYTFWKGEAFSSTFLRSFHALAPDWCHLTSRTRPDRCPVTLWQFDGKDPKQLNHEYLPLAQGGTPESTSARIIGHCLQNIAKGVFTKYDFGFIKNIFKYGSFRPPMYDLTKITAPLINYYSDNDFVASKTDAMELKKNCPTLRGNFRINYTDWNHFDFIYGKDADILVYDHVLQRLKEYNPLPEE